LDRLDAVEPSAVAAIVAKAPRLSDVAGRFVVELLDINRRRLLRDR
jgi:hypothetical protein